MVHSSGDRRPRGEAREQVRARIQAGALECFSEKGLAGATMAEIARRAGVSPGALYLHFPSKQALFESLGRPDLDQPSARVVERRGQILAAARRVFAEKGYAAATMDEIAACAGLSKAALYGHFDNKEELFLGALRDAPLTDAMEGPWRCAAAAQAGPEPKTLREYLVAFVNLYIGAHADSGRLELMRFVLAESMHDAGVASMIIDRMIEHSGAMLAGELARYTEHAPEDLQQSAETLLGLLFAWVLRNRILQGVAGNGGGRPLARPIDERAEAEWLVDFFLDGLRTKLSAPAAKRRTTKRKP